MPASKMRKSLENNLDFQKECVLCANCAQSSKYAEDIESNFVYMINRIPMQSIYFIVIIIHIENTLKIGSYSPTHKHIQRNFRLNPLFFRIHDVSFKTLFYDFLFMILYTIQTFCSLVNPCLPYRQHLHLIKIVMRFFFCSFTCSLGLVHA